MVLFIGTENGGHISFISFAVLHSKGGVKNACFQI
jgi:hypothetical protein